jgi:hypothetical protein
MYRRMINTGRRIVALEIIVSRHLVNKRDLPILLKSASRC